MTALFHQRSLVALSLMPGRYPSPEELKPPRRKRPGRPPVRPRRAGRSGLAGRAGQALAGGWSDFVRGRQPGGVGLEVALLRDAEGAPRGELVLGARGLPVAGEVEQV